MENERYYMSLETGELIENHREAVEHYRTGAEIAIVEYMEIVPGNWRWVRLAHWVH